MDYKIIDIEGIGDVYAQKLIAAGINKVSELLEKCAAPKGRKGVDTVKEFRHRVAENLQPKLEETNAAKNICNRVPAVSEIQKMIDQAKELEPKMTY